MSTSNREMLLSNAMSSQAPEGVVAKDAVLNLGDPLVGGGMVVEAATRRARGPNFPMGKF